MKTSTTAAIVLALATLTAGQAMAASNTDVVEPSTGQKLSTFRSTPSTVGTRAQVRADAVQASKVHAAGDVVEPASGQKLSTVRTAPSTVGTRAEVRADAVQASKVHNPGDVVEPATGQKLNGLFAGRYADKAGKAAK